MCESKVDPSEVRGVYEEWGWISVKVYQMYANESDLNYANANECESEWVDLRQSMIFVERRGFERT